MEGAAEFAYHRLGVRYLLVLAGGATVVAALFAGFDTAVLQMYRNVGVAGFPLLLVLGQVVNAAGLLVGFALFGLVPLVRLGRAMTRIDEPIAAREVLDRAARFPGRVVPPVAVVIILAEIPAILWFRSTQHVDFSLLVTLVAILAPNATAAFFLYLALEVLLRPVVRDAAEHLSGEDHRPVPRGLTLRQKLLFGLPIVNFMTAYVTAAFVEQSHSLTARIALAVAAAFAVTITVSMLLTTTLVHSFSEPVRLLIAGSTRVGRGDLSGSVAVVSGDEMGVLAGHFNQMTAGLRERAELHSALGSYVEPSIAERVARTGPEIAGESVMVTVMFLDIVGFTSRVESMEPQDVVDDLNEFFGLVIPPIERCGGHVNKLLGDGLMAVFGAPRPLPDHADRALEAALEITGSIDRAYAGDLAVGIGLNSGSVIAGSMGGGGKLDYTIIGDVVNVASRVEGHTRATGDAILLTESTRALLSEATHLTPRGSRSVKGRQTMVEMWAPLPGRSTSPRS